MLTDILNVNALLPNQDVWDFQNSCVIVELSKVDPVKAATLRNGFENPMTKSQYAKFVGKHIVVHGRVQMPSGLLYL